MTEPFAYKMQRLLNERIQSGSTFTRYHYAMRQAARKAIMSGKLVTEENFVEMVKNEITNTTRR